VIRGIAVTAGNYKVACDLLKERFGRPEQIIFAHIQALLNLQPVPPGQKGKAYVSALWKQQDVLLSHIRSLEVLGVKGDTCGVFLTPLILSRLPDDIRMEWSRDGEGKESDLKFLLTFLQREIKRLERSACFKEDRGAQSSSHGECSVDTFSATLLSIASRSSSCIFCSKRHISHKCRKVNRWRDRRRRLFSRGLCFRCLSSSHLAKTCSSVCST